MLKQHQLRKLRYGDVPDLLSLTKIPHAFILEDLEQMIRLTVDPTQNDYGVFTGIQIRTPAGDDLCDLEQPRLCWAGNSSACPT